MSGVRTRARRGEGDRLRQEILTAVSQLLDETSDEAAVSIRAIAERVGVSAPSIYRHFADKDELLSAVCAEVFGELRAGIDKSIAGARTPLEALRLAGIYYVEFGLAHPEHYRLVFMRQPIKPEGLSRDEFIESLTQGDCDVPDDAFSGEALSGTQAFAALFDLVGRVLAETPGRKRPDPFAMTTSMWMAMHGITSLRITKPDFVWPSVADQLDAVLWPWRQLLAANPRPT